jgi:hypothetical protein
LKCGRYQEAIVASRLKGGEPWLAGGLGIMPSRSADVRRRLTGLDALVALVALALGFSLVGLVLIVAFPLVSLVSAFRIAFRPLLQTMSPMVTA